MASRAISVPDNRGFSFFFSLTQFAVTASGAATHTSPRHRHLVIRSRWGEDTCLAEPRLLA